jgi:hypothetical protein
MRTRRVEKLTRFMRSISTGSFDAAPVTTATAAASAEDHPHKGVFGGVGPSMRSPRRVAVGCVSKAVAGIGASEGIVALGLAGSDDVTREEWRVMDGAQHAGTVQQL